jgi:hypothetical protein
VAPAEIEQEKNRMRIKKFRRELARQMAQKKEKYEAARQEELRRIRVEQEREDERQTILNEERRKLDIGYILSVGPEAVKYLPKGSSGRRTWTTSLRTTGTQSSPSRRGLPGRLRWRLRGARRGRSYSEYFLFQEQLRRRQHERSIRRNMAAVNFVVLHRDLESIAGLACASAAGALCRNIRCPVIL